MGAKRRKRFGMESRKNLTGWIFLAPATIMILWMSFYPMIKALLLSFQTGVGANMSYTGVTNYTRLVDDNVFKTSVGNTFIYLICQVPIMLVMAIILASMLNDRNLKFKGLFRTAIFLPCATSLVSYSLVFRTLFATNGLINSFLMNLGLISENINWLGNTNTARLVIVIALLWRWTGYNMVFYLSALQNIEYSIYEAAKIDGAGAFNTFKSITVPLLKPTILLTAIMSTNGTLQLFDESVNLTNGGPANSTITMSHYLYKISFGGGVPNFGYAAALSFVILLMVAILAFIQMKVGDTR